MKKPVDTKGIVFGTRVRTTHLPSHVTEGTVCDVSTDPKRKPLTVMKDDGTVAYFHYDQVEVTVAVVTEAK